MENRRAGAGKTPTGPGRKQGSSSFSTYAGKSPAPARAQEATVHGAEKPASRLGTTLRKNARAPQATATDDDRSPKPHTPLPSGHLRLPRAPRLEGPPPTGSHFRPFPEESNRDTAAWRLEGHPRGNAELLALSLLDRGGGCQTLRIEETAARADLANSFFFFFLIENDYCSLQWIAMPFYSPSLF